MSTGPERMPTSMPGPACMQLSKVQEFSEAESRTEPISVECSAPSRSAPQVSPAAKWLTSFGSRSSQKGGNMTEYLRRASSMRSKPPSNNARNHHLRHYSVPTLSRVRADAEGFVFGEERKYRLGPSLGWGATSVVREVFSEETLYAVKIICRRRGKAVEPPRLDIWSQLPSHDNLLPLLYHHSLENVLTHTAGQADVDYLVMDLCTAGNLLSFVRQGGSLELPGRTRSAGIPTQDAQSVMRQLTSALKTLHAAGIVHCDLKLENVLGTKTEQGLRWRIADFGLAYRVNKSDTSEENDMIHGGTLEYWAPEIVQTLEFESMPFDNLPSHRPTMNMPIYSRANPFARDMWALGCILYALMSGHLPFSGQLQSRLQMDILRAEYEVPYRLFTDEDLCDVSSEGYVVEDVSLPSSVDTVNQLSNSFASLETEPEEQIPDQERRVIRMTLDALLQPDADARWDVETLAESEWIML